MTAPIAASVTIDPAGNNNAIVYTAATKGIGGNGLTVAYTTGATAGSEVVTVTGPAVSIQVQANTSTGDQIKTAVEASAPATALVTVADDAGNDGSGAVVGAVTATSLAGGADGFPDRDSSPASLSNRRLAAAAVLGGWADANVSTVLTTARAAGYRDSVSISGAYVGGIVAGDNR